MSSISNFSLLERDRLPFATGVVRYVDATKTYPAPEARIVIPLALKSVAEYVPAVVDTAAPWCIFEPGLARVLAWEFTQLESRAALSTRLGKIQGALYRGVIRIPADEGEPLEVEATVFFSPDWRGPNFIGYQGLLQRIRFAVDPETNLFYFGQI